MREGEGEGDVEKEGGSERGREGGERGERGRERSALLSKLAPPLLEYLREAKLKSFPKSIVEES